MRYLVMVGTFTSFLLACSAGVSEAGVSQEDYVDCVLDNYMTGVVELRYLKITTSGTLVTPSELSDEFLTGEKYCTPRDPRSFDDFYAQMACLSEAEDLAREKYKKYVLEGAEPFGNFTPGEQKAIEANMAFFTGSMCLVE